jgi:hypothetical protein
MRLAYLVVAVFLCAAGCADDDFGRDAAGGGDQAVISDGGDASVIDLATPLD